MATQTQYTEWCAHGYLSSSPYGYTSGWAFGDNGSHKFKASARFPALGLQSAVISNISLVVRRIDSGDSRTVQAGINLIKSWTDPFLSTAFNLVFPSGTGTKTIDLTSQKDLIQSFTTPWYLHLNRNNSAKDCHMDGDEDGTKAPRIVVTYENATVEYYTSGAFQKCLVHYRMADGTWQQCIPYYYKDGIWARV